MFSQACIKKSLHRGRRTAPSLGRDPLGRDPPQADTPARQTAPSHPIRRPLQRTVRILLKCILVIHVTKQYLDIKLLSNRYKAEYLSQLCEWVWLTIKGEVGRYVIYCAVTSRISQRGWGSTNPQAVNLLFTQFLENLMKSENI